MAKDIIITPASGILRFSGTTTGSSGIDGVMDFSADGLYVTVGSVRKKLSSLYLLI